MKNDMRLTNQYWLVLLIAASLVLAGCNKKSQADSKKSNSQVVAMVNGDEITIHQVNFQLGRMGQMNEAQAKLAAKQVLTSLVGQQLLKQQALDSKLDRDPMVLQALESTKDQLLAQAYLEKLMAKAPKPSTSEIDSFYKEHPELFEKRRVFRLQELVVNISKDKFAETAASLQAIKGINEIATWLKDKNYIFTVNSNVKAAEQLPLEVLKKLQLLKDGEVLLLPTDKSFNIIQIAASETAPIARAKATPIIEQYFLNQNKTSLAKKEMVALNEKANIEFIGAFSDMKKSELINSDAAKAGAETNAPPEASAQSKPAEDKSSQTAKSTANPSSIDKGLSGL
jgi:EpsD family peptidyl-prolyl cis-trans isomerase